VCVLLSLAVQMVYVAVLVVMPVVAYLVASKFARDDP